jgi:NADH-quinone oxidoreductase subunit F
MPTATTERPLTEAIRPDRTPLDLAAYEKAGGYQGLRRALEHSPREVQEIVTRSGLRGRGGAGFPTGQKWSFVPLGPEARRPKYLVVNGDEMEPGTMKDRWLMEGNPHELVEGAAIAAYAIEAEVSYIYIRGEYTKSIRALERAVAEAERAGYLGGNVLGKGYRLRMHLHVSAGRYMCGEESGLIDALEGRRATPRSKPPFPQTSGLWGKPTVVDNVETLCCVPHILVHGPEWFHGLSRSEDAGTKIFGASGHLRRPGLWELPMGTTMREILEEHGGGMQPGYQVRAVLPGGASTEFVPAEKLDTKMDFASVAAVGSRLGTGTMVVLDDRTCPVGMLASLERFFARESCGFCTPCREGLPWVLRILLSLEEGTGREEDLAVLESHTRTIRPGTTYCALAPGAMEPLASALVYFRSDIERHIREKKCPWKDGR